MDLNIGTAFWFASRGQGRHKVYEEMTNSARIYDVNGENNRPLLRLGEEGALRGVGLDPTKLRASVAVHEGDVASFLETRHNQNLRSKNNKVQCSNPGCQMFAKHGCDLMFCKRCCDRNFRENKLREQVITSDDLLVAQVQPMIFLNTCAVHKAKTSQVAKISEKGCIIVGQDDNSYLKTVQNSEEADEGLEAESVQTELLPRPITDVQYTSQCKVLLVGLGADEQLAGYGRHRTVYQKGGITALQKELNIDLVRLWERNLGRDDRCIADNGKEAWYPYLDEQLVQFIQSTPLDIVS